MSGPSIEDQEAIRAALGLVPGSGATPRGPEELVSAWAADVGLGPGRAVAGTTEDLYRVFEDWCRRLVPDQPVPHHWAFTYELRRAGFGRKAKRSNWWMHLCCDDAAETIRAERERLGILPPLDWSLSGIPSEYRGQKRPKELQDEEYHQRRARAQRKRDEARAKRTALQRRLEAAASRHLVRPR